MAVWTLAASGSQVVGALNTEYTLATLSVIGEALLRLDVSSMQWDSELEVRIEAQLTLGAAWKTLDRLLLVGIQPYAIDSLGPYEQPTTMRIILQQRAGGSLLTIPWATWSGYDSVADDARLARAGAANKRTLNQSTAVKVIYDNDGVTVLRTLAVSANGDGTIVTEAPA